MARIALLVLAATAGLFGGCTWPFKRAEPTANTVLASPLQTGTVSGLPLLTGPQAAGHTTPIELPPKQAAVACLAAAQELDKNGQVKEAVILYERAREQDPSSAATISRRLAVLYDLSGDFAKATSEYTALLAAKPNDPALVNDFGYSYYARGDFARAEEYLKKAAQLDPNSKRAWLNLGLVVAAQNRYDEGFQAFRRAGSEAEAHTNLAFVMTSHGRTEDAKAAYRRALELEPGLAQAQTALQRLENPPANSNRKSRSDRGVIQAGGRDSKKAVAEDVPTIYEIEERFQKEDGQKKSTSDHP